MVRGAVVSLSPIQDLIDVTGNHVSVLVSDELARRSGSSGPAKIVTGADGTFEFQALSRGSYTLTVQHPSYLSGGLGQEPGDPNQQIIQLGQHQRLSGLDIAVFKPAVITGRISDESDEALTGIDVRALRQEPLGGQYRFADGGAVRTDDRGIYRFSSLSPGRYVICVPSTVVSAPAHVIAAANGEGARASLAKSGSVLPAGDADELGDYRIGWRGPRGHREEIAADARRIPLIVYSSSFYPSVNELIAASLITAKPGDQSTAIDIQVQPRSTVRVAGRLRLGNMPLEQVGVRLLARGMDAISNDRGIEAAVTISDSTGAFEIFGVPPGDYTVAVLVSGNDWAPELGTAASFSRMRLASDGSLAIEPGSPAEDVYWAAVPISVGSDDLTGVDIAVSQCMRIEGRVQFETHSVLPTIEALYRKTTVQLTPVDAPKTGLMAPASATTTGEFKTAAVVAGRYFVSVKVPGTAWKVKSVLVNGRDVYGASVTLDSGTISDAIVTLTDQETSLTGKLVQDAAGVVSVPEVISFPADIESWIRSGMNPRCAKSVPAINGSFVIDNLQPGDYLIAPRPTGRVNLGDPEFIRGIAAVATRVTVHEGANEMPPLKVR